ncbi:MAG: hypothetical protein FJW37_05725, partial [Acidobacteria bacterium]|nr:hypothetical protein [Acidobacteriota bacterium]
MSPLDFDPAHFDRGRKHALELEVPGHDLKLPLLLVRGASPGKTLVATAAVHGDEYEGVRAIFDVSAALAPADLRGDFLAVPVANPPAFWNGTRTSPLDGGNLARVFPGSYTGPTPAIARSLAEAVIARADLFVDLHSAGVQWLMPTMVGYDSNDRRSRAAAAAFGAPVMWGHPAIAPGRTVSFAASRGIPWLYTEARGAGRIDPGDLRVFVDGLGNLLRHLEILEGAPRPAPPALHLYGDGNVDQGLTASQRGFLIPEVELLDRVRAGQRLGRLCGVHGETLETFAAPADGVVALVRQFPVVAPGDPLFLVTGTLQ